MFIDINERRLVGNQLFGKAAWYDASLSEDAEGWTALPPRNSLDSFSCGSECQDFSRSNTESRTVLKLEMTLRTSCGTRKGTKTFLQTVWTIQHLGPRSFTLENVSNCKLAAILSFLSVQLPQYTIWGGVINCGDVTPWIIVTVMGLSIGGYQLSNTNLVAVMDRTHNLYRHLNVIFLYRG